MNKSTRFNRRHTPHLLGACIAAAVACPAAHAEANPYYIGIGQSFTHDSNLLVTPDGTPATSTTISTTSLLAGIDQPFGRQRLTANASVRGNRYSGNSEYNNTAYGVDVALDWATIERISGRFGLNLNQNLARFNPGDAPTVLKRNMEQAGDVSALFRVGGVTDLTIEGTLDHRQLRYSAREFNYREVDQDAAGVGFRYKLGGALTLGAGVRHSKADYPRFQETAPDVFVADTVKRDDLDLTALWEATGASTVDARVSLSRARHTTARSQDFSGATGSINWRWKPTGKVTLNTTLLRETGVDTTFFSLANNALTGRTDGSRLTTGLQVRADYELTAKIALAATLRHQERSLTDTLSLSQGATQVDSGTDRTQFASLGARWTPIRSLALNCDATHESRSTSTVLSQPYKVSTYGCGVQFILQ